MEVNVKNSQRLDELEKELANAQEEMQRLNAQFENEKAIFDSISRIKLEIEDIKKRSKSC